MHCVGGCRISLWPWPLRLCANVKNHRGRHRSTSCGPPRIRWVFGCHPLGYTREQSCVCPHQLHTQKPDVVPTSAGTSPKPEPGDFHGWCLPCLLQIGGTLLLLDLASWSSSLETGLGARHMHTVEAFGGNQGQEGKAGLTRRGRKKAKTVPPTSQRVTPTQIPGANRR